MELQGFFFRIFFIELILFNEIKLMNFFFISIF